MLAALASALCFAALSSAPAGAVSWSAGYASFGKVHVGDRSDVKQIVVRTNSYCQPYSLIGYDCSHDLLDIAVSGPFAIAVNTCVGPGATRPCAVGVRYKPTRRGRQDGFLRIAGGTLGNPAPQGVPLVGKGCSARRKPRCPSGKARRAVGWSSAEDPLRFGRARVGDPSDPQVVEVTLSRPCSQTNAPPGENGVVCFWEGLQTGLTGPFEVVRENCVTPPASRPRCTIELRFTATRRGRQRGSLLISAANGGTIPLLGVGCKPSDGRLRCDRKR